jgi:hypothetical protein
MSSRSYCESSLFLDIRRLARAGQLELASPSNISWQCEGTIIGSTEFFRLPNGVRLRYSCRSLQTGACTEIEQIVPIVWSNCAFGGKRPWFLCPTINHDRKCLGRVAVLYLATGPYFACRKCHNLAYASQAEPVGQRGIKRARAIRMKLGGGENILDSFPPRPNGMHRRTYSRLQASYQKAARRCGAR